MKTDVQGCSTTPTGAESYEVFAMPGRQRTAVQYDYRASDGALFSCVARTLWDARRQRWTWESERAAVAAK